MAEAFVVLDLHSKAKVLGFTGDTFGILSFAAKPLTVSGFTVM